MAEEQPKQSAIGTGIRTVASGVMGQISGGVTGGVLMAVAGAATTAAGLALGTYLPDIGTYFGASHGAMQAFNGIANFVSTSHPEYAIMSGAAVGGMAGAAGGVVVGGIAGAGAGWRNSKVSSPALAEIVAQDRTRGTTQEITNNIVVAKLQQQDDRLEALEQQPQQAPGYWVNLNGGPKSQPVLFKQIVNQPVVEVGAERGGR